MALSTEPQMVAGASGRLFLKRTGTVYDEGLSIVSRWACFNYGLGANAKTRLSVAWSCSRVSCGSF